ncbi:WD repeat-containing protein jip5 [Patellaria atrata CBS 101060]|uniref:WD repeat-containing protein JIP5 n=1 Tax=Patellaria atrata CBS 101060 TaxID=1346257 RepID=A0A9P4SD88_9PEZI|nr:WD repeat-containing protein jip5 [Patellaria atrata CBS 101060]
MFDTICTLQLTSDLFTQILHPREPLLAIGLAAGHVQTFRLPPVGDSDDGISNDGKSASENGCGQIETGWRTRRHKGSCRSLAFGIDGETLYSAGTDGIVKAASSETGQVASKVAVPIDAATGDLDVPSLIHCLSPQTLLLATDSSALYLYDLRVDNTFKSARSQQTYHPHDDYISSLTPLPPSDTSTSGFSKQWVSTGGTTLAVTDLRRGVLVRSEDQEEELLSSLYVGGLPAKGTSRGEKILAGGDGGVLTLWERGVWDDQDERIIVYRGAGGGDSLDALTLLPENIGPRGKTVAVGGGGGEIRFVKLGMNKVIGGVRHDEAEGVIALGFDVGGRMISGGGQVIKVWHEAIGDEGQELDGTDTAKREADSDSDDSDNSDDNSSERESTKRKRKKRKRNKGRDKSGGRHVMAFQGLD